MKINPLFTFLLMSLFLLSSNCNDNHKTDFEKESAKLDANRQKIKQFAASAVCNSSTECRFIKFGSKPCGGPWEYLIFSTSIDTLKLTKLVNDFNSEEEKFNKRWDQFSDCSVPSQPSGFDCLNGKCNPIYD